MSSAATAAATGADGAAAGLLRVLCLHGSQQTKETFRARLGKLPHRCRGLAGFVFVDAPHELALREGESVATRTWFDHRGSPDEQARSVAASLAVLGKVWHEQGPFDGALGFSMGGAVCAAMAARPATFPGLRFVFIGGAPAAEGVSGLWPDGSSGKLQVASFHAMGLADEVVRAESSRKLAARFAEPELFEHAQGHCLPTNKPAFDRYVAFLERQIASGSSAAASTPPPAPAGRVAAGMARVSTSPSSTPGASPPGPYPLPVARAGAPTLAPEFAPAPHIAPALNIAPAPAPRGCVSDASAQEQRDEMEAMSAIYAEVLSVDTEAPAGRDEPCGAFRVRLAPASGGALKGRSLTLRLQYPYDYPASAPQLQLEHDLDLLTFPPAAERGLRDYMRAAIENEVGAPCAYSCARAAEAWLADESLLEAAVRQPELSGGATHVHDNANASGSRGGFRASAAEEGGGAEADAGFDDLDDFDEVAPDPCAPHRIWEEPEDETKEAELVERATVEACAEVAARERSAASDGGQVAVGRGVRKFVVGLVGKPSAGKSTFFNCVTRLQVEAKVGAHPFTTIEPNFGSGWWVPLEDAEDRGEFASRHGRDARGRRLLPLLVKDVAGLIPGAYKGLGKGNRFLNDLCDADVLIHVVDVSGSADRNGVAVGMGDPAASSPRDDVKWVREELHRWVFGNVAAKWRSVVRYAKHSERLAAERVHALFSGYRGAHSALSAATVRAKLDLGQPQTWSRFDLHRVVAHFLSVRFPMTLALNKADKLVLGDGGEAAAQAAIEAARALARDQGYAAVPCSAATETALLGLARAGAVAYDLGESRPLEEDRAALLAHFGGDAAQAARRLDAFARVIAALGGTTGVLDCVSRAVALRHPLLVFPVADVRSGLPVGPGAGAVGPGAGAVGPGAGAVGPGAGAVGPGAGAAAVGDAAFAPGAFRDCLQVLPGTTVEDVFAALKRNEIDTFSLDGDFVRAECGSMAGPQVVRQVGKDAVLDRSTRVVKILCNKKPVWQQAHARQDKEARLAAGACASR